MGDAGQTAGDEATRRFVEISKLSDYSSTLPVYGDSRVHVAVGKEGRREGGKTAASKMTKAERSARVKRAAAASAKVRSKKAAAKKGAAK